MSSRLSRFPFLSLLPAATALAASCGRSEPRQPDLPEQPDRWVNSVALDPHTRAKYIGRTKDYGITTVSAARDVNGPRTISVGDRIEGVQVGAIRCSFYRRDVSYGGEQYMWRGRWGCQAGRSREEVERAVGENGEKRFDYIRISPVRLDAE